MLGRSRPMPAISKYNSIHGLRKNKKAVIEDSSSLVTTTCNVVLTEELSFRRTGFRAGGDAETFRRQREVSARS